MNLRQVAVQFSGVAGCLLETDRHAVEPRVMALLRSFIKGDWGVGKHFLCVFPHALENFVSVRRLACRLGALIEDGFSDAGGVAVYPGEVLAQRLGGCLGLSACGHRGAEQLVMSGVFFPIYITRHVSISVSRASRGDN